MDKTFIDKLAYIHLKDGKVLVTLSHEKDTWYVPGGKREAGESDEEALIREVKEELTVDLIPQTIKYYGTFQAQAHGKPEGTEVRLTCYTADFNGELSPSSEIERIDFFSYADKDRTTASSHLLFDDLLKRNLLI
jgi:8-oxo-dGTP pyrophosphatase MutT (NUDIX family)